MIETNDESSSRLEEKYGGFGFEFPDDDGRQPLAIVGGITELGGEEDEVDGVKAQLEAAAEVVDCDVGVLVVEVLEVAHFSKVAIMFI